MTDFSSCVVDTSVIVKALFSPSKKNAGAAYARELKTHQFCVALLAALDEHGSEVLSPLAAYSGLPQYQRGSQIPTLPGRSARKWRPVTRLLQEIGSSEVTPGTSLFRGLRDLKVPRKISALKTLRLTIGARFDLSVFYSRVFFTNYRALISNEPHTGVILCISGVFQPLKIA